MFLVRNEAQLNRKKRRIAILTTIIVAIICFLGCSYQIFELSDIFFAYNSVTEITIEVPSHLAPPITSFCYPYIDVLDYDLIRKEIAIDINLDEFPPNRTVHDKHFAESLLTIEQIFKYTPKEEDLFIDCLVRLRNYGISRKEGKACLQWFSVTKYYVQEYICYRLIQIMSTEMYSFKMSAFAISNPESIYVIKTNQTAFRGATLMRPVIHEVALPFRSLNLSPWFELHYDAINKSFSPYKLMVTYGMVKLDLLPPPYNTNCRDYVTEGKGLSSRFDCQQKCLIELAVRKFKKVPFSGIITEPYNYKHISPLDVQNHELVTELSVLEAICDMQCKQFHCKQSYSLTKIDVSKEVAEHSITIKIPQEPFTTIKFRPSMTAVEYFIYLLGCMGTWFGLSVIGLNPSKLMSNQKRGRTTSAARRT